MGPSIAFFDEQFARQIRDHAFQLNPFETAALSHSWAHIKPGGTEIVNVLVEGTTYFDMFDPASHCLFERDELARRFEGWTILASQFADYPAPGGRIKSFATLIARKPGAATATQA